MKAHITTLKDLQNYAQGQVVELPPFAEGQPFVARIIRPSIIEMAKNGQIPNTLLANANSLFTKGRISSKDDEALQRLYDVLDIICEASFLKPTFAEIKESGIKLTDEQYMFIFNYAQRGVKALETFRHEPKNPDGDGHGAAVQRAAL